jgi:hypothetical protein
VNTSATAGWSAVGRGDPSSAQSVVADRSTPACNPVNVAGSASWIVPRSHGWIGR